jgi:SOS-response transcriptional repressor LexA
MEGDYVLLQPTSLPELISGAIVAARIDGSSAYYRFFRNERSVELQPLEGRAQPSVVENPADLNLLGRVTGLYRRLDHATVSASAVTH